MSLALAALIAALAGVGVYHLIHRSLTKIIIGVGLLSNAVNLLIVSTAGGPGQPPIVAADGSAPRGAADPLPQALVLTAIVIGLSVLTLLLSIAYRSWTIDGNDEVEDDIGDRQLATLDLDQDEP